MKLRFSSPCNLQLSKYPFGEYECNVTFSLGYNGQMKWVNKQDENKHHYRLEYQGSNDLFDFHLRYVTVNTDIDKLTLTLHLSGNPSYHVINSFSPSCLMFVICYSTLYFPLSDFNERIMASLTSLLVLVGLFAQASNTYVKTPYIKILDLWYVLLIGLCFLVVIAIVVVNLLRTRESETPVLMLKVFPRTDHDSRRRKKRCMTAATCNVVCRVVVMVTFICVCLGYILVGSGTI